MYFQEQHFSFSVPPPLPKVFSCCTHLHLRLDQHHRGGPERKSEGIVVFCSSFLVYTTAGLVEKPAKNVNGLCENAKGKGIRFCCLHRCWQAVQCTKKWHFSRPLLWKQKALHMPKYYKIKKFKKQVRSKSSHSQGQEQCIFLPHLPWGELVQKVPTPHPPTFSSGGKKFF